MFQMEWGPEKSGGALSQVAAPKELQPARDGSLVKTRRSRWIGCHTLRRLCFELAATYWA